MQDNFFKKNGIILLAILFLGCQKGQDLTRKHCIHEFATTHDAIHKADSAHSMHIIELMLSYVWSNVFDERNPRFVVYPYPIDNATFEIKNNAQYDSPIPSDVVVMSIYPKDTACEVFIEHIEGLWKDNPGKYIRGFVEFIDPDAKVWYVLSDTPDGNDTTK